jgi:hypothetical protein
VARSARGAGSATVVDDWCPCSGFRSKKIASSAKQGSGSRASKRARDEEGTGAAAKRSKGAVEYPKRVSRKGLIPAGTKDRDEALRALVVNSVFADAAALERTHRGTDLEFIADAANRVAEDFQDRVEAFFADHAVRKNLLSPGVSWLG